MEKPLTSDPVLLTDLNKGDLFFIRLPDEPEAQLAILISESTADPILIKYDKYYYERPTHFYQSEVPHLKTFRVHPADYMNPSFQRIYRQLFPKRLGPPIDESKIQIGKPYYFNEGDGLYVMGILTYLNISQFGEIRLQYREMPIEGFPNGIPHSRNYSPGYLSPYVFEYKMPPPSRLSILRKSKAIMERNGPEDGLATIRHDMAKSAIYERAPLVNFYYKTRNAERKKWEEEEAKRAAAEGGGGGAANNTTKGGVRRTGRFRAKHRRRYTKRK